MKFCLLVLVSVYVGCFSDGAYAANDIVAHEYVGNPDDDAIIERPCLVYDLNCIRQFFAKHSKCIIRNGPIPDPLHRSQYPVNLPFVNITATQNNVMLYGLNRTRIEEFYINRASNKVVFTVEMRNIRISSPTTYFRFYRNGREPITAVDFSDILLTSMSITAIIPNIDDMQLDNAEVSVFVQDSNPVFIIGPGIANNPDPVVAKAVAQLIANVPLSVHEGMLTSLFYPPMYIQYNICDFGLKVLT